MGTRSTPQFHTRRCPPSTTGPELLLLQGLCGITLQSLTTVTQTDDLAVALDEVARCWPDLSRAQLLVRLALEGHRAAQRTRDERRRRGLDAIRTHSGCLNGGYGADYLKRLREDWPA